MPTHVIAANGEAADPNTGNVPVEVVVYQLKTVLTDAQIKALPTTPVQLVPAPGAGKILIFHSAVVSKPAFTTPYGNTADFDGIYIGLVDSGVDRGWWKDSSSNGLDDLGQLLGSADNSARIFYDGVATDIAGTALDSIFQRARTISFNGNGINQPLNILGQTSNGNFTGGHASNTLEVTVFYSIVDL